MNIHCEDSSSELDNAYVCVDQIRKLTEQHEDSDQERQNIYQQLIKARSLFEQLEDTDQTSKSLIEASWVYRQLAHYSQDRPAVKELLELAISNLDQSLTSVDTIEQADLYIQGIVTEIECLKDMAEYQQTINEREACLGKALSLANACSYLCFQTNNTEQQSRLAYLLAHINGKYYKTDRDSNLLEAIRCADYSIDLMQKKPQQFQIDIPSLYNEIGNYYANLRGNRNTYLNKAKKSYESGLASLDQNIAPRLHTVLRNNIDWAVTVLEQGSKEPPEKEMTLRFKTVIQDNINQTDLDRALQTGWEYLQWSWTLPQRPNANTASAHLDIGYLVEHKYNASQAISHYHAAYVIAGSESLEFPDKQLCLSQARQALENALDQASAPQETIEAYLASAESALDNSFELCHKAEQLAESDLPASLEAATGAISWYPFNPYAFFYQGISFLRAQNYAPARHAFTQSININPDDILTWFNRGLCNQKLNQSEMAISDFEHALTLDAGYSDAMMLIARICIEMEHYEQGISKLDLYIEKIPDLGELYMWRSLCYDKTNQRQRAIDDLTRAMSLCDNEDVKAKMVTTLESLKQAGLSA